MLLIRVLHHLSVVQLLSVLVLRDISLLLLMLDLGIVRHIVPINIYRSSLSFCRWGLMSVILLLIEIVNLWRWHLQFSKRGWCPTLHGLLLLTHNLLRDLSLLLLRDLLMLHLLLRNHWSLHHHIGPRHNLLSHSRHHLLSRRNLWRHPLLLIIGRTLLHLHHARLRRSLLHMTHHTRVE